MDTYKADIDALNKQAWEVRVNDSNKAHQLSKQALDLSNDINYTKGQAEASRTLGFTLIRLSQHNAALTYLNNAMQMFEQLNDLRGQSDVYEYYGIIHRSVSDYKSSLDALYKALELRKQTSYKEGESLSLYHLGVTYRYLGNLDQALEYFLQSLAIARQINAWIAESYSLNNLGSIYMELNDHDNALHYFKESLAIRRNSGDKWGEAGCLDNIGLIYFEMGNYEEAINSCSEGLDISEKTGDKKGQGNGLFHLGKIYGQLKNFNKTVNYYKQSLEIRRQCSDKKGEAEVLLFLAELSLLENYYIEHSIDPYNLLNIALKLGEDIKSLDLLSKIHQGFYRVSKHFDRHQQALEHLEKNLALEKEIHSATIQQKVLNLEIEHRVESSKREMEIYRLRNIELVALYEESSRQKEEIEVQKKNLEQTLVELKLAQAQLIQSEKMASLGELTAGIAHEIQNPLNFVNNFSEVNKEMIAEADEEIDKGNYDEVKNILNDIKDNSEKINHHGKRADAIVKGMLQHSRQTSGTKEPTDINALCDEYLRLSYHGLRAKDKEFNATMKTDFEESIGNINIIPQDIGRVLLNLYNNAFYAVNEKKKAADKNYQPTVIVQTKKINDKVEIKVTDNGNGIPQNIVDKIFQPFFTTKPTGEGTGLGLSLSYDIVKTHNGEIKVESQEREGSKFTILLPA
jgi:two-component system NtrC family sensor kinase